MKTVATSKTLSRTCIMALGMHRSGTSALTRVISLLGATTPTRLIGADANNESGYWEPALLNALHDEMLAEAGSRWDDWRAFDPATLEGTRLDQFKERIKTLILEDYGSAPLFVLKEPRICRFVPLYQDILTEIGISPCYVLPHRNPLAVIASLAKRDGMTMGFASLLWLRHVLDAEAATRAKPRLFLSYEAFLEDWRTDVDRMAKALNLKWPRGIEEASAEIESYLSRDLQHHAPKFSDLERDPKIAGWVKQAYEAISKLVKQAKDATALTALDRVKAEFEATASVFGEASFPELAERENRLVAARDHFVGAVQRKQTENERLEAEAKRLEEEAEARDRQIKVLSADVALKKQEIETLTHDLEAEISNSAERILEYHNNVENLKGDLVTAQAEAKKLQADLNDVYMSTSWRISSPIRVTKRAVSRFAKIFRHPPAYAGFPPQMGQGAPNPQAKVCTREASDPAFAALSKLPDPQTANETEIAKDGSKLIAFYLPQYHRIPENSEWWGPGFTEWTNVAKGKPNFVGHHQPNIPRELGYYDLTHTDIMREQAELARLYGIHGFCFYHYWFSGRRILDKPVENFLKSDIVMNFCLCWANENWTRTWDGDTKSVLMEQKYADGDAEAFIDSLIDSFRDRRYITIDDKPLLLVYRAKDIPDPKQWFGIWRERVRKHGFSGLHIAAVDFYDISTPDEVGADSLVEFPPHKFNGPQNHPKVFPTISNPNFAGGIIDYVKVIAQSAHRPDPSFKLFRGIMPSWDNTARRQDTPTIVMNARPDLYGAWLSYLRTYARSESPDESNRFIFINAWNEWGEGCYIEPDQRWGLSYLEQTLKSSYYEAASAAEASLEGARDLLFQRVAEILAAPNSYGEAAHSMLPPLNVSTDRGIAAELTAYSPASEFARKVSTALLKYPTLHRVAKFGYMAMLRIRG
jgi:hypothetical protein